MMSWKHAEGRHMAGVSIQPLHCSVPQVMSCSDTGLGMFALPQSLDITGSMFI